MKNQIIIILGLILLLAACGKVKRPQHNIYTKSGEKWVLVEYRDEHNNVINDFFKAFEFDLPAIQRNNYKDEKNGSLKKFFHGESYDSTATFFTMRDSAHQDLLPIMFIVDDSKGNSWRSVYFRIGDSFDTDPWISEFRLVELDKKRMVLVRNVNSLAGQYTAGERLVFEKQ